MSDTFSVNCTALRDLELDETDDLEIFTKAKGLAAVVIVSKDSDFADLVMKLGQPPQILWVTCGNCSTAKLREMFSAHFVSIHAMFLSGESLVELSS